MATLKCAAVGATLVVDGLNCERAVRGDDRAGCPSVPRLVGRAEDPAVEHRGFEVAARLREEVLDPRGEEPARPTGDVWR
jgi:hypothetical protein